MILPDKEQFTYKEVEIGGDACWLIIPNHIGTKWSSDNERFRSCVVRQSDHYVISQGFKKFVNFFESPDFQPWNNEWKIVGRCKIDGSCLIVSRYKGSWVIRTRGTIDARQMPNGYEIDFLMEKYSQFFDNKDHADSIEALRQTWLFEWTTPTNIICIRESKVPELSLIGIISNDDASYYDQDYLDIVANQFGFKRPEKYEYQSLKECIDDVENWKGKEGIVLHSPDFQTLKKIKSSQYLALHRLATGIKNISNVLDVFIESPRFIEYEDFYKFINDTMDYEIAERVKDDILKITEAYTEFVQGVQHMRKGINHYISGYETRKEQALEIQRNYTGWMLPVAFSILDGKQIDDKMIKKSMEKILCL